MSKLLSRVQLFVAPWTVDCQAPLSMEFSRQEYWSGLPFPSPEDLPDPGIEPGSPALQADFFTTMKEAQSASNIDDLIFHASFFLCFQGKTSKNIK